MGRNSVNKEKIKSYIPLFITLGLGLFLFFQVENFIRTVLVIPMLYLAWTISVVVESIPQAFLWGVFVFLMLVAVFSGSEAEQTPHRSRKQMITELPGTVESWAQLLEIAQKSRFSRWRLANRLKRLTWRLLSPTDENDFPIYDFSGLELPADIKAYFDAGQPAKLRRLNWFNEANDEPDEAAILDLDVEIVIDYLKAQLASSSASSRKQEQTTDE